MATNNSINAPKPFSIANGGTGQTTQTAAFNALSPLTTKGDIVGHNGTNNVRLAVGTDGQVLVANSGAATGLAWSTTNLLNSNTIAVTSFTMSGNQSYITNAASLVTYTLPSTIAVGQVIEVVGFSAGGWSIAQNSGQVIHFNNINTTTGVGGSISSTNRYDVIQFICVVANTDFVVKSASGNLTIV